MSLDLSAALEAAEHKHAELVAEKIQLRKALKAAEATYLHRHFCHECLPARGCGEFYPLLSRAVATRAALKERHERGKDAVHEA